MPKHSPARLATRAPEAAPAAKATPPDRQRWRCPAALRVKSAVLAAAGVAVALVFFPPWFGIPVAAVLAAWGVGMAALGASVTVDRAAGTLVLRVGLVFRRVKLTDVTAVLVDRAKVSIGRTSGGEVSVYAWRKSPLDALLRVPAVAGDIGHAISSAVALAKAAETTTPGNTGAGHEGAGSEGAGNTAPGNTGGGWTAGSGGTPARARSRLATALLGGAGVLAIVGALLVRVHWHNPALTVLGVILALGLGAAGLLYLLVALWILLTGRAPRITGTP